MYLVELPAFWLGLGITFCGAGLSVAGLYLARRLSSKKLILQGEAAEEAGAVINITGTIFAVMLAFVVIVAWQKYDSENERVVMEASALGNLYRDSRGLDSISEEEIQVLVYEYTNDIIADAWPKMAEGEESKKAWQTFNRLYTKIVQIEPANAREEVVMERLLNHLNELSAFRRLRLKASIHPGLPAILWASLLFGAVVTLLGSYFFRIGSLRVQGIMTASMGGIISLMFFLILLLSYPYSGSLRISPVPLERLLSDVYPLTDSLKEAFSRK